MAGTVPSLIDFERLVSSVKSISEECGLELLISGDKIQGYTFTFTHKYWEEPFLCLDLTVDIVDGRYRFWFVDSFYAVFIGDADLKLDIKGEIIGLEEKPQIICLDGLSIEIARNMFLADGFILFVRGQCCQYNLFLMKDHASSFLTAFESFFKKINTYVKTTSCTYMR